MGDSDQYHSHCKQLEILDAVTKLVIAREHCLQRTAA